MESAALKVLASRLNERSGEHWVGWARLKRAVQWGSVGLNVER